MLPKDIKLNLINTGHKEKKKKDYQNIKKKAG